jgi:hypothetical protein
MNLLRVLLLAMLATFPEANAYAQHLFSVGAKMGIGSTVTPINPILTVNADSYLMRTNGHLSTGAVIQYLIGNRIGMESGFQMNVYTFNLKNETGFSLKEYFCIAPRFQLLDYQIPVQVMYKIPLPRNLYKHIKLVSGTSIDWLTTQTATQLRHSFSLHNFIVSARIGKETLKHGRMEYGLEYQYSLKRFKLESVDYNQPGETLDGRLSMLCFNFYYFFLNRNIRN